MMKVFNTVQSCIEEWINFFRPSFPVGFLHLQDEAITVRSDLVTSLMADRIDRQIAPYGCRFISINLHLIL